MLHQTRRQPAWMVVAVLCATTFASALLSAQSRQSAVTTIARQTARPAALPVRRVVLYKSGVGYFEHLGRVRGNQTVSIDFTTGQLDDVLTSMTMLDLDGGRISGVSYNSEAALDRQLGALRLPLGQQTTRTQFLSALRGARLEVRTSGRRIVGRLLSVETIQRQTPNGVTSVDAVAMISDAGELQTIALDAGVGVRILDEDLSQEVGRYLSLMSSTRAQDLRRMNIGTSGTGERDLFVSYISEVPVWKATYRLVLPDQGAASKSLLQGWAIVDNTIGEDWDNVVLSLVAGAPQSFVQSISRPYYVQRPIVPLPQRVLLSPQTHQTAIGTAGPGSLAGTVTSGNAGVMPGVQVTAMRNGARVAQARTNASGRFQLSGLEPGTYELQFAMTGFVDVTRSNIGVNGGMETVVSVTMSPRGVSETVAPAPAPISAPADRSLGIAGGRTGGVGGGIYAPGSNRTIDGVFEAVNAARAAQQADAEAAPLGDLFEYKITSPVTLRKNQSALVPILSGDVGAERVSLWNASRGPHPLRAVWLTNETGLTLDGGNVSVMQGQAFAGEALMDPLKAGERRLLSYANDLALTVDAKGDNGPLVSTRVQVVRGTMVFSQEEHRRRTYTARNEDAEPRVLVIEHPVTVDWKIDGTVKPAETTPNWYRFRMTVDPKTTATFSVDETHPIEGVMAVSTLTPEQVDVLVRDRQIDAQLERSLRDVVARKGEIARLNGEVATRDREIEQISSDQSRIRENMQALKGSSAERQLLQRYVRQLEDQETRLAAVRVERDRLWAELKRADDDLARTIEQLGR